MTAAQAQTMRYQMFEIDRYKTTAKSRWISEAVDQLLEKPYWLDIVAGVMLAERDLSENHVVMMEESLKLKLDEACINLKKEAIEGRIEKVRAPVGTIIRAAIMDRCNPLSGALTKAIKSAQQSMAEIENE